MSTSRWLTHRLVAAFSLLALLATAAHLVTQHAALSSAASDRLVASADQQRALGRQAAHTLRQAAGETGPERLATLQEARAALGRLEALRGGARDATPRSEHARRAEAAHRAEVGSALAQLDASERVLGLEPTAPPSPHLLAGLSVGERALAQTTGALAAHYRSEARRAQRTLGIAGAVVYGLLMAALVGLLAFVLCPAVRRIGRLEAALGYAWDGWERDQAARSDAERHQTRTRSEADAAVLARRVLVGGVTREAALFAPLPEPAPERRALRGRRVLIAGAPTPARDRVAGLVRRWGVHVLCVDAAADACAALEPDADLDAFVVTGNLADGVPGDDLTRELACRLPDVPALLLTSDRPADLPSRATALAPDAPGETLYRALSQSVASSALRILQPTAVAQPPLAGVAPGDTRVLVAEDHAVQRAVIVRTLEGLGAAVHAVANGLEAAEAMAPGGFDIAFLDIQMPVMDGLTAAQLIRRESATVRLVALTGTAGDTRRSVFAEAGFDTLLLKPLRRADALGVLEQARSARALGERSEPAQATVVGR